ncbi:MAG: hypothetical protein IH582_03025 [Afipia sp.]|nr:hypothetical protein [Afipia sp.]
MKFKRSHAIVSVIVALVAAYYGWWFFASGDVFHSSRRNAPNRAALRQVYEAVSVGASHSEVLSAYWQHRSDSLRLFADRPTGWVITMPQEFGASDWELLIEFQDGRVSAVRVRTSDGPPPKDGPKDKQKGAG